MYGPDLTSFFGSPSDSKICVRYLVGYLFAYAAWRDSSKEPIGPDVVVVVRLVTHSLLPLCKGKEEVHAEALILKASR